MPPPKSFQSLRRKSCHGCVKAKRRCDLAEPRCQRCQMRQVACVYPRQTAVVSQPSSAGDDLHLDLALSQAPTYGGQYPSSAAQLHGHGTLAMPAPTPLLIGDYTNIDIPAYMTPPVDQLGAIPQPLSPGMFSLVQDILRGQRFKTPLDLGLSPSSRGISNPLLPSTDQNSAWRGDIVTGSHFQPRTEYAARLMVEQPTTLATNGYNCFIHHSQANSSAVLQDALAASALQAMRNPSNAAVVRMEIMRRAKLLVTAVEAARENYLPLFEMDFLPPVQALLIYQCMRLFSVGDSTLVAQAEKDQEYLQSWVDVLDKEIMLFGPVPENWETWVRRESVRRTLVFAEMLGGVYRFLRNGWDSAKQERMASLGFSAQRALWSARTADGWALAWSSFPRLEVVMSRTLRDMKEATSYDVDDLGVILRATYFGLENVEQWIGDDASALEKWGLRHSGRGWRPVNPDFER